MAKNEKEILNRFMLELNKMNREQLERVLKLCELMESQETNSQARKEQ